MDHLFWRLSLQLKDHQFAWILGYIWKSQNSKVFSNLEIDPKDTFKSADTESILWAEAQLTITHRISQSTGEVESMLSSRPERLCFTDGSWKEYESYSEHGWYSTLKGFDGLMGTKNTRPNIFPLYSKVEAFIWAMKCMRNLQHVSCHFCNGLFSIGEDGFRIRWMTILYKLLRIYQVPQEKFQSFRAHLYLQNEEY